MSDGLADEIRARLTDVHAVIAHFGLGDGAHRDGAGMKVRCPGHDERTASCHLRIGQLGTFHARCFGACQFNVDVIGFAGKCMRLDPRDGEDMKRILDELAPLAGVSRDGREHARPSTPAPPPRLHIVPASPAIPLPLPDLEALWQASFPVELWGACLPPDRIDPVAHFVLSRGWDEAALAAAGDIVRALPPTFAGPPWWPASWSSSWRFVARVYDTAGQWRSLHARAVDKKKPKTRWPWSVDGKYAVAGEVVFADDRALALLRKNDAPPARSIICEGITDWTTAAQLRLDGLAVFGAASGGFPAFGKIEWPAGHVVIAAADADPAGDKYMDELSRSLPAHVELRRLALAKGTDVNDLFLAKGVGGLVAAIDTAPIVEHKAPEPPPPEKPPRGKKTKERRPPGARVFDLGSDVEIGRALLTDLADGGEALIYDRGALHKYDPARGIWPPLPRAVVERRVHAYDGAWIASTERLLRLSNLRVLGSVERAEAEAAVKDFFVGAKAGLAFANGFVVVDAEGVMLAPHAPANRASLGLAIPYDETARAPAFEKFLDDIFSGDEDAAQKRAVMQEFIGASLAGIATQFQQALILLGAGSNGKSVFIDIVTRLFPPGSVTAIAPQDFDDEYRVAMLAHARLNAVSELPEAEILSGETMKAIIAGDVTTAREIREAPFQFRPIAGQLFAANRLPGTTDQSGGFWRRFIIVTFNRIIDETKRDPELAARIIESELPGIARWALAGAERLLQRKAYTTPPSGKAALVAWRTRADQVRQFVDEKCRIIRHDSELGASGRTFYQAYRRWASENGHAPLNNNKFAERLEPLGIFKKPMSWGSVWNVEVSE